MLEVSTFPAAAGGSGHSGMRCDHVDRTSSTPCQMPFAAAAGIIGFLTHPGCLLDLVGGSRTFCSLGASTSPPAVASRLAQPFHHAGQLLHRVNCSDCSRLALRLQNGGSSSAVGRGYVCFHLQRHCHGFMTCVGTLLSDTERYQGWH